MAKRFTDTEIWKEDWFIDLSNEEKLFWFYLKDSCNHAGIWKVNLRQFEFILGSTLGLNEFLLKSNSTGERIVDLGNGNWYLKKFVKFQYGEILNENNRVHKSIIDLLNDSNIDTNSFEVKLRSIRPLIEVKEGVKDKDKDKEKENIEKVSKEKFEPPTPDQVAALVKEKIPQAPDVFCKSFAEKFCGHYESVGWRVGKNPMKSWQGAVSTWSPSEKFAEYQDKNKSHKQFSTEKTKL
jgi:hypothetical protein